MQSVNVTVRHALSCTSQAPDTPAVAARKSPVSIMLFGQRDLSPFHKELPAAEVMSAL